MAILSIYHDKFTTLELEKKADEIMDNFDFEAVHKHMQDVEWKWHIKDMDFQVPDINNIKSTARYLLTNAIWDKSTVSNCSTGGFHAYKLPWGLELTFSIETAHS